MLLTKESLILYNECFNKNTQLLTGI